MSWEDQARCHQFDPDIFFDPRVRYERKAKTVCAKCPVRIECLAFALEWRTEFGVWGGLSSKERRSLLRRFPRSADWLDVAERVDGSELDRESVPA